MIDIIEPEVKYKDARYYFAEAKDNVFIDNLINEVKLNEPFDWKAKILIFEYKDEQVGLVGFNFQETDKGLMPRFEHILLTEKVRRTKLAVKLLLVMEYYFKSEGYNQYLVYVRKDNERMKKYASHWGMVSYLDDNNGTWYFKNI
jgi:hypothetical protein